MSKKVKLKNIQTLTFKKGKQTTFRRIDPISQLKCVRGNGCSYPKFLPNVVQCVNMGSDGDDIQWKCSAEMESDFHFGETTVICEGFDYPDDPFILQGSCGLEYELFKTNDKETTHYPITIFLIIFIIMLFFWKGRGGNNNYNEGYDPRPPFNNHHNFPPKQTPNNNNFWWGLGLGGILGSLYSRNNHDRNYYYSRPSPSRNYEVSTSYNNTHTSTGYGGTRRR
jgi:hypothetical protein